MSNKSFIGIPKKECLEVYKNVLDNSNKKWESASKLAQLRDYGSATSLAIISVEELIKSSLLLMDGKGFEIRSIKGIDTLFTQHKIRYVLAYIMFVVGVFGEDISGITSKWKNNPKAFRKDYDEYKADKKGFEKKFMRYLMRKFIILKKEFDWFSQIDLFRQDGFYSDYEDQLKNPIEISRSEYIEVIQRLEKVRRVGKDFILMLEAEDEFTVEQIQSLRIEFKKKGYYKKLGESLKTLRSSNKSPFETIREKLDEI